MNNEAALLQKYDNIIAISRLDYDSTKNILETNYNYKLTNDNSIVKDNKIYIGYNGNLLDIVIYEKKLIHIYRMTRWSSPEIEEHDVNVDVIKKNNLNIKNIFNYPIIIEVKDTNILSLSKILSRVREYYNKYYSFFTMGEEILIGYISTTINDMSIAGEIQQKLDESGIKWKYMSHYKLYKLLYGTSTRSQVFNKPIDPSTKFSYYLLSAHGEISDNKWLDTIKLPAGIELLCYVLILLVLLQKNMKNII